MNKIYIHSITSHANLHNTAHHILGELTHTDSTTLLSKMLTFVRNVKNFEFVVLLFFINCLGILHERKSAVRNKMPNILISTVILTWLIAFRISNNVTKSRQSCHKSMLFLVNCNKNRCFCGRNGIQTPSFRSR